MTLAQPTMFETIAGRSWVDFEVSSWEYPPTLLALARRISAVDIGTVLPSRGAYGMYQPSLGLMTLSDPKYMFRWDSVCSLLIHELAHSVGFTALGHVDADKYAKDSWEEEWVADMVVIMLFASANLSVDRQNLRQYWRADGRIPGDAYIIQALDRVVYILTNCDDKQLYKELKGVDYDNASNDCRI